MDKIMRVYEDLETDDKNNCIVTYEDKGYYLSMGVIIDDVKSVFTAMANERLIPASDYQAWRGELTSAYLLSPQGEVITIHCGATRRGLK